MATIARRCAYLTMDDIGDFVSDADLSVAALADLGWSVQWVSWRETGIDWHRFDLVYICTPWDYQDDVALFLEVLEAIEASSATLVNCLELVRWNLQKTYLLELDARGADIVPSLFQRAFDMRRIDGWFDALGTDTIVIKPVIGANAEDTFVVTAPVPDTEIEALHDAFGERAFIVQPFISSILSEGEYSLFFFGRDYSHAIRKQPKANDFRTQEEHGADILAVEAPDTLIRTASDIVSLVEPRPAYARADLVRDALGRYRLMELELIEPSLYFRTDSAAAERFARALVACTAARAG